MRAAPTPDNPGLLNWLLIVFLGVIWGAAFMAIAISLEGFTPAQVAAGRIGLAAILLLFIGRVVGQPLGMISATGGRRGWVFVAMIGALSMALPLSLLTWGQQFVPSAFAGITMGTVPLLVLPLAYIFSPEEGIGPRRIIGMILGFIGLALLVGPGAFDTHGTPMAIWGQLACVATTCCYAAGSIITRRAPKMPPLPMATGTLVVASAIVVPLALWVDGIPTQIPPRAGLALLYAAFFPTAIAMIIRMRVITTAGSVFMSLTSYMVPVWATAFGVFLMGERLPAQIYAALALILAGIFIAQSRQILALVRRR